MPEEVRLRGLREQYLAREIIFNEDKLEAQRAAKATMMKTRLEMTEGAVNDKTMKTRMEKAVNDKTDKPKNASEPEKGTNERTKR